MASSRGKWTMNALKNCMKAVSRQNISVRESSKRFGISRTLRNHLKTGCAEKEWVENFCFLI